MSKVFNSLVIWNSTNSYDISDVVVEMSYYESLFDKNIHGQCVVQDTNNLIEQFPFTGEEYISFNISDDGGNTQSFDVYGVRDVEVGANNTKTFSIMFSSSARLRNDNLKLSRFFEGSSSEIINEICQSTLGLNKKELDIANVNNSIKYVVPRKSAFDAIQYISSITFDTVSSNAAYYFFQSNRKYRWDSLGNMFLQGPVAVLEDYASKGPTVTQPNTQIQKWHVTTLFNKLEHFKMGMYGATAIYHDLQQKQVRNYALRYTEKKYILNNRPLPHSNAYSVNSTYSVKSVTDNNLDEPLQPAYRSSQQVEMGSYTLNVDIGYVKEIAAGDIVSVLIVSDKNTASTQERYDKALSGKYIVTRIKHAMNKRRYTMTLQLNKESTI